MKRWPVLFLVAIIAVGVAPASADAKAKPFHTGVAWNEATGVHPTDDMKRIRSLGARYVRVKFDWSASQRDPGLWRKTDRVIRAAASRRLQPILTIVNPPRNAFTQCVRPAACQLSRTHLRRFARQIANRYSGRSARRNESSLPKVSYWQLWDDINRRHRGLQVGRASIPPAHYRAEINIFADALRSVSRRNAIITGGVLPAAVPGREMMPLTYLRRLLCLNRRNRPLAPRGCTGIRADIIGISPYTAGSPSLPSSHRNDLSISSAKRVVTLARVARRQGHLRSGTSKGPVWATQLAWKAIYEREAVPGVELNDLTWGELGPWIDDAFERLYRSGVTTVIWNKLRDDTILDSDLNHRCCEPHEPPSVEWLTTPDSGIITRSSGPGFIQTKMPIANAIQFPLRVLATGEDSIRFWGRIPDYRGTSVKASMDIYDGRRFTERKLRIKPGQNGIVQGRLTTQSGKPVMDYEIPPNVGGSTGEKSISLRLAVEGGRVRAAMATPQIEPMALKSTLGYDAD